MSEGAQMLIDRGIKLVVAEKVAQIFASGLLSPEELDGRAFEALQHFNEDAALEVLESSYLRYLVVSGVVLVRFD